LSLAALAEAVRLAGKAPVRLYGVDRGLVPAREPFGRL